MLLFLVLKSGTLLAQVYLFWEKIILKIPFTSSGVIVMRNIQTILISYF